MIGLGRGRGSGPARRALDERAESSPPRPAASHDHHPDARPLSSAPVGCRVVVTHLDGDERFRGRLVGLGLGPGASVAVAGGGPGRPRVLGLAGCRVAIDDASARRVFVRPTAAVEGPGR
jgi:Fe2+ transport system protein FeoA